MKTVDHRNFIYYSALAKNTRIAYARAWQCFETFCAKRNIAPLAASPEQIADFLVEQATLPTAAAGKPVSIGTVHIYCSAINRQYSDAGLPSPKNNPLVTNVLRGLTRLNEIAPRQVKALREHHIEAMLEQCEQTPLGVRDAALITLGFAGALRRSEICNLQVADIEIINDSDGRQRMFIHIRKSKTDQAGKGARIAIPEGKRIHPIKRLEEWLTISGVTDGHLFRSVWRGGALRHTSLHPSNIARIVKYYATRIGLNDREIAGHSLRAGFVTSAAVHHARLDKIMEITRHRNPVTVLRYIRDANAFTDHAAERFL